jgi:subtilisin family serine protease
VIENEAADDPSQHNHGTYTCGLIGAYLPGTYTGGAYDASFILCKTEDVRSETPIEEDNYAAGLQFIEAHGGDLMSSSLGYIDWYTQADLNGHTAVCTQAVNVAIANGLICMTAAGNEGHDADPAVSHFISPADAPKVITCGAVDSSGAIAYFSSDGPSADGRVKPEVLAWGVNNIIVRVGNDTDFTSGSGTSFATPTTAAAVACLLQAHPTWTVAQMRAYLFTTADYYAAHHTFEPTYVLGYGIVRADVAVLGDCNHDTIADAGQIASGALGDCKHDGVPDVCRPPCTVDFNNSGCVEVGDIFAFLALWFARDTRADFNHDLSVNTADIFAFLGGWFAGCTGAW